MGGLGRGLGCKVREKLHEPLLIFGRKHESGINAAHQPFAGPKKKTAGVGATKTLQFGAGNIDRLRRQEGVDEKIGDAVTANECDGLGKFARTKVPVPSPIRMVEALEEGAKTIAPLLSRRLLESLKTGRDCRKCADAAVRVVGRTNA